jgi:hypothetical protein
MKSGRYSLLSVVLLAGSVLLISPRLVRADEAADQAIRAYEKYLERYRRCTVKVTSVQRIDSPVLPTPKFVASDGRYRLARNGDDALRLTNTVKQGYMDRGKPGVSTTHTEALLKGPDQFGASWDEKNTRPSGLWARLGKPATTEDRARILIVPGAVALFGLWGDQSGLLVTESLRQSSPTSRRVKLAGRDIIQVEATSRWGYSSVWLDPQNGYAPVRLQKKVTSSDWVGPDTPLSTVPKHKSWAKPEAKIASYEKVAVVSYGRGSEPPLTVDEVYTDRYENGQEVKYLTDTKVTELNLNPDFDGDREFEFKNPPKNGARVHVENHPNLEYEWQNGKVVKSALQGTDDPIPPVETVTQPDRRWRWVAAGAAAIVAAAACWWLLSRRR